MSARFYDELAPYYHLLYGNWEQAISRQGTELAAILLNLGVEPGGAVLDAASGIGTQTLGLLMHGYRVMASDISPKAIERLRAELSHRALQADTRVDDLRTLASATPGSMSAVLACDNSIPHLLSDSEILQAFRSCYRCLRPRGVALFSVRDYETIERKSPDVRPYGMRYENGSRFLAVQVWEWDGDQYDLRMYLTSESPGGACETRVLRNRYYAVGISRLLELLTKAGFEDAQRMDNVFFQPVLVARRPNVT